MRILVTLILLLHFLSPYCKEYVSPDSVNSKEKCRTVRIDPSHHLQTFDGWGVSLCWWASESGRWSEAEIDTVIDWLVSPQHLNYNVFRYNIPGGDDPQNHHCDPEHMKGNKGLRASMAGFKSTPDAEYDWNADEAQIKIMRKIIEKSHEYGKKPVFEAFANTPPWWMTVSGCCAGAEDPTATNLRPDCYDAFAQYLVDVCLHFRDVEGIEFHSLEPFNEPNTNYWRRNGCQEGCGFKTADQIDFLRYHLWPILKNSGLNTVIAVSDETNERTALDTWRQIADTDSLCNIIRQYNTHTYYYGTAPNEPSRNEIRSMLRDEVGKTDVVLWMSETGAGGKGIAGNLALTKTLFDDMRYMQPTVWCDWQYIDTGNQWGTITCAGTMDRYLPPVYRNKNFFVRRQVTSYILPGSQIIETDSDNVLAAISPDRSKLTVCIVNDYEKPVDYDIDLGNWICATNPIQSATYTDANHDGAPFDITSPFHLTIPSESILTVVYLLDND